MEKIFDTIEDYRNVVSMMKDYYKELSANIREEKTKYKNLLRGRAYPDYMNVKYHLDDNRRNARIFNVVYSILKGKSYKQIEPKIREKNELYGGEIRKFCEKWNLPSDPFVKEVNNA